MSGSRRRSEAGSPGSRLLVLITVVLLAAPAGAHGRTFKSTAAFAQGCQRMTTAGNNADLTVEQLAEAGQLRGYADATIDSIEALYPNICLPEMSLAQVCAALGNWYGANPAYGQAPAYTGLVYALKQFYPCPPPAP